MSATHYHTSVLLHEATDALCVKPDGVYVDATFGGGGHSRAILEKLGSEGTLIAFDQDEDAWRNKPDDARLIPVKENFRYLRRFLRLHGHTAVDGILADLGVSSYQFDTAARGFSLRFDGPLDMRMDKRNELTAAKVLQTYSEQQLHTLFEQYGEVRNARQLAKTIVEVRKAGTGSFQAIASLKAVLDKVVIGSPVKYYAQVFQAIRIEVNDEMGALKEFLVQASQSLKPGGRLCVITFHSIEDRIVKQFIKSGGCGDNGEATQLGLQRLKAVHSKPLEPGDEEMKRNPRARSAKLRTAVFVTSD